MTEKNSQLDASIIKSKVSCGNIDVVSLVGTTSQHSNFSVSQILKKKEQKRLLICEKYDYFYNLCLEKISNANNAGMSDIIYSVPKNILSVPDYNCEMCINYISDRLILSGFNTDLLSKNQLFITWLYLELNIEQQDQIS